MGCRTPGNQGGTQTSAQQCATGGNRAHDNNCRKASSRYCITSAPKDANQTAEGSAPHTPALINPHNQHCMQPACCGALPTWNPGCRDKLLVQHKHSPPPLCTLRSGLFHLGLDRSLGSPLTITVLCTVLYCTLLVLHSARGL